MLVERQISKRQLSDRYFRDKKTYCLYCSPQESPFMQFRLYIFYKPACLQKNLHGRLLSSWYFPRRDTEWADSVSARMNIIASLTNFNQ